MKFSELVRQTIIPVEENQLAPEKGGELDKAGGNTSGVGVEKVEAASKGPQEGGVLDKLSGNTSGAGVGTLTALGAGYAGLRFASKTGEK